MDLLSLIIIIAITYFCNKKDGGKAKERVAKLQKNIQQSVYRSKSSSFTDVEKKTRAANYVPPYKQKGKHKPRKHADTSASSTAKGYFNEDESSPCYIEQQPEREQRDPYTKVFAGVKPLKNAYENDEHCEHRIELNPNIAYSNQKRLSVAQRAVIVKTDGDSVIQGMIWAEILGKPKAIDRRRKQIL